MGNPSSIVLAAVLAAGLLTAPSVVSAAPLTGTLPAAAVSDLSGSVVEQVKFRRPIGHRGGSGGDIGAGVGIGIGIGILGAILEGAAEDQYQDQYYGNTYYPHPDNDGVGYCIRRFRSYDRASHTYLGNDGFRHYCP